MTTPQPNGAHDDGASSTITLQRWQVAEIRRQLYIDLADLAEQIRDKAGYAAQMNANDDSQRGFGDDLSYFVHSSFADAARLLDVIGWDVAGDTAAMIAHATQEES